MPSVNMEVFKRLDFKQERKAFYLLDKFDRKMEDAIKGRDVDRCMRFLKRREDIVDLIVSSNLDLVFDIGKDYNLYGRKLGRMLCEGNSSLIQCVDEFNRNIKLGFKTFAARRIRRAMLNYLIRSKSALPIEDETLKLVDRTERFIDNYKSKTGKLPTIAEIRQGLKLGKQDETKMIKDGDIKLIQYYFNPVYENCVFIFGRHLYEIIAEGILRMDNDLRRVLIEKLGLIYENAPSLKEMSEKYNIKEEVIKSLEDRFISDLKEEINKSVEVE
jgi:DNA-directed RNA polymerase sigma subunit (sigma70/sigma32)